MLCKQIILTITVILLDVFDWKTSGDADIKRTSDADVFDWAHAQRNYNNEFPVLGSRQNTIVSNTSTPVWVRRTHKHASPTSLNRNKASYSSNTQLNRQEHVNAASSSNLVTDEQLQHYSEVLLDKDINNAAKYVTVKFQRKTTSRSPRDEAPLPLLLIDQDAFKIPTIQRIIALHDNYVLKTNVREEHTLQEEDEENRFLDDILETPIMQHTRNFLIDNHIIDESLHAFRNILRETWFDMYSRENGRIGSSGFEHVFLAEIKKGQISGLHNWLYFFKEESAARANYLGYMKKIDLGTKGYILKYHFTFNDIDKPVGSMFIGTSPELEIALYTTCFLIRADRICPLKLNGHRFVIRTYSYRTGRKKMIGSAFPDI